MEDSEDEHSSEGIFEQELKIQKTVTAVHKKKEVLVSSAHPVMAYIVM